MTTLDREVMEHDMKLKQIEAYLRHRTEDVPSDSRDAAKLGTLLELAAENMTTHQTCGLVERMVLESI